MSRISYGKRTKRDRFISESSKLLLFLEHTASTVSDWLQLLFPSALPVTYPDRLDTSDLSVRIRGTYPLLSVSELFSWEVAGIRNRIYLWLIMDV